jgi:hypothetical protein
MLKSTLFAPFFALSRFILHRFSPQLLQFVAFCHSISRFSRSFSPSKKPFFMGENPYSLFYFTYKTSLLLALCKDFSKRKDCV